MGIKKQSSVVVELVVLSDGVLLGSEENTEFYYLGDHFNQIKVRYPNVLNIDFLSREDNEISTQFLVNLDSFFESKWFSFTNTCSANRYLSLLYDEVLQAKALMTMIRKERGKMVVLIDSQQKYNEVKKFLISNNIKVQSRYRHSAPDWVNLFKQEREAFFNFLKGINSYLRSQYLCWKLFFQAAKLRRLNPNRSFSKINVITWMNNSEVDAAQLYEENNYFGFLPGFLDRQFKVTFIGQILNNSTKFPEIAERCISLKLPIIFVWEFLEVGDILYSFFMSLYCWMSKPKKIVYEGIDYSRWIKKSLNKDFFNGSFQMGILFYRLFKALINKLPQDSIVIYPFENQPWEKALLMANLDFSKNVRMMAYQFFPMTRYFPIYLFSDKSREKGYVPDKLLTSDVLSNELFVKNKINTLALGNFRLQRLIKNSRRLDPEIDKPEILCSLFLDEKEAVNLAQKALAMTKNIHCQLWINYHSMLPKTCVQKIQSMVQGLPNVALSQKSASFFLETAVIVLYHSTTVCWEAAMRGIPIVYVECQNVPNLDRFHSLSLSIQEVKEGEQLIQKLLQDKQYYFEYSQRLYNLSREKLFPISETQMEQVWV